MKSFWYVSIHVAFIIFCLFYRFPVVLSLKTSFDTVNANNQLWKGIKPNLLERTLQRWDGSTNSLSFSDCKELDYCSLKINDEDAEKFRSFVIERKALAVFTYVTVGNFSQKPCKRYCGIQIKEKLAWIRNKRGKFLATLPYDFDILSLTTLTKDVFDLHVHVNSTPANCFTNMSQSCIYNKVADLLGNVAENEDGNICIKASNKPDVTSTVSYYCCIKEKRGNDMVCNVPVESNQWIRFAIYLLWALASVFGLFSPLVFKYFPKEFRKGSKSKSRQRNMKRSLSSNTSIDSLSLISTQKILFEKNNTILDILRTRTTSVFCARISRCLFIIILSCFPVLQALLYIYLKKGEVGINQKDVGVGDAYLSLIGPTVQVTVTVLYCFCILLICIAVAIPHSLSDLARRLAGRKDERNFLGFEKPESLICTATDTRGFQLLYQNMVFHLNSVLSFKYWKFVFQVTVYPLKMLCYSSSDLGNGELDQSRSTLSETQPLLEKPSKQSGSKCSYICNLCFGIIFFPIWAILIQTAFLVYVIPVTYVAFRIWRMLFRLELKCNCCEVVPNLIKLTALPLLYLLFIVFCCCVEVAYFLLIAILSVNVMFLGSIIGFTIAGLIFYIEFFLPYIVLTLLGLVYIIKEINSCHSRYVHLKNAIFEACERQDAEIRGEIIRGSFSGSGNQLPSSERKMSSSSPLQRSLKSSGLVFADEDGIPSIPFELFLCACNEFLPFKRIVLAKLLKLVAVFGYFMAVFSFVMSLVEFKAASSLVQSIAILLLGAIPFYYSKGFAISEREQKRMESHLQDMVRRYQNILSR